MQGQQASTSFKQRDVVNLFRQTSRLLYQQHHLFTPLRVGALGYHERQGDMGAQQALCLLSLYLHTTRTNDIVAAAEYLEADTIGMEAN